jgi:hypothetical protein
MFDLNRRTSALMMWPGTGAMINGRLPHFSYPYANDFDWRQRVKIMMSWLTDEVRPANLVMAYFNEPDSTAHKFGPFSPEVRQKIVQADRIVQYLLDQLQSNHLLTETNLIVLSDHGMAEVNDLRIIDLSEIVDSSWYDAFGTSPVLNLWLKDKSRVRELYEKLLSYQKSHHFTVYLPSTVPTEYHYRNNDRILDIIIEADEGYEVVRKLNESNYFLNYLGNRGLVENPDTSNDTPDDILIKFKQGEHPARKVWGNHGYSYKLDSMRPMFVAYGPAFRKHLQYDRPFQNIDLYPLMCEILHIRSSDPFVDSTLCRSNGSLSRVKPMLRPIVFSGDLSDNGATAFKRKSQLSTPIHVALTNSIFVRLLFVSSASVFIVLMTGFVAILLCASVFTCFVNSTNRTRKRHELAKIDLSDDIIDINIDSRPAMRQKRLPADRGHSVEHISLLGTKQDYTCDSDQLTE